nr:unnamed protein product [Trichobilharzia regenti]
MHVNMDPARYRGLRDLDLDSWDDEAAAKLRFSLRPSGDLLDYLSLCRHPCGLRALIHSVNSRPLRRTFGVIWFVRDLCGIICLFVTWMLILYAEFVIDFIILGHTPSPTFCWISGTVYHFFALLAVVSHFKAFTTDPGSIPIGAANQALGKYLLQYSSYLSTMPVRCTKCLSIKPLRAHHCRICQRCIRKMDHHCPWVNNCVGEGNQKYFILFAFYICLMSFSAIAMCIYFIFQCLSSDWEVCQPSQSFSQLGNFSPLACSAFALGLICESLMFGIFTLVMCISQLCAISNDETGIENFKKEQTSWEKQSSRQNFMKAFGSRFSWKWFSPFSPPPPLAPVVPGLPNNFDSTVMLHFAEQNATRSGPTGFQTDLNQVLYVV